MEYSSFTFRRLTNQKMAVKTIRLKMMEKIWILSKANIIYRAFQGVIPSLPASPRWGEERIPFRGRVRRSSREGVRGRKM
ncbi:MAG: hypothetical protein P8Z70_03810 [Desulfuromonadales bacterium]